jgi:hypothetical protein
MCLSAQYINVGPNTAPTCSWAPVKLNSQILLQPKQTIPQASPGSPRAWTPTAEQDLVSGTLLVRFGRGQSGAAISVPVYDLLVEEAGDGAAEECEGRDNEE